MSRTGYEDRVLLSRVSVLTFYRGRMTTSRRSKSYPELVCDSSGSAGCPRGLKYQFPSAMCSNVGLGDDGQPRWACTADYLPDDVDLGNVWVGCEGYSSKYDPYVLVGSCNLTYTLERRETDSIAGLLFFIGLFLFCCCCCMIKRRSDGKKRAPPPEYTEVAIMEPIAATAIPVDVPGKPLYQMSAGYEDPEHGRSTGAVTSSGKGSIEEVSNVTMSSASNVSGGMGTGTAVAVGAAAGAAATAAVAATAVAASRAGQGNLPQGWEARVDPYSGETYYVDHSTRATSWIHPGQVNDPRMHHVEVQNQSGPWGNAWTRHASPSADPRPSQPGLGAPAVGHQNPVPGATGQERQALLAQSGHTRGGAGWGSGLGAVWKNVFGDGSRGAQGHTSTSFGSTQQRDDRKGGWGWFGGGGDHTSTAFGGTQRRDGPSFGGGGGGGHTSSSFGGTHRR